MGSVTDETSDKAATKPLSFESTYAMHAHSRVSDNLNTSMKVRNEPQRQGCYHEGARTCCPRMTANLVVSEVSMLAVMRSTSCLAAMEPK